MNVTKTEVPSEEIKKGKMAIGLDVGTMTLVCAKDNTKDIRVTRNVFLKVDPDEIDISSLSNISYVISSDKKELFIVGDDAFQFANIFSKEVSRPMQSGLISPKEASAIEVLALILQDLIGDIKHTDAYCSYSVPAEAIDEGRSVIYHEKVFGRILSSIGVNHTPVNEGMAVIYSECIKEEFSGVALSFGAGLCNVAISFKGVEALTFSTPRSGDWIDHNVAESLGMIVNRVTNVKEKNLDLQKGFSSENNKKVKRVLEALEYYYKSLVTYTIKKIIKEFDEKVQIEIDGKIPVIISGGTSLPNGFLELFKETLNMYDVPFNISEIRRAKNPLTAVANGLLIKTLSDIK